MTTALVTGVAGFIGSHLAQRLLADGFTVTGVDAFTDFYPRPVKERNLAAVAGHPSFTFVEGDLCSIELAPLLAGVENVFHQAAQAGVRTSWGERFAGYLDDNLLATQRLLEACRESRPVRFVFASSSSVYGDVPTLPMKESDRPSPFSPYGVTKLAAEHLVHLYGRNYGLPVVSLRYFTVYGPRQRPDMAHHRLLKAAATGGDFPLYGDGRQTRDFTFVDDIVEANLLALGEAAAGKVYNVGGGTTIDMLSVIRLVEEITGKRVNILHNPVSKGDVRQTLADTSRIKTELGFFPRIGIAEGLEREYRWLSQTLAEGAGR